MNSRATLQVDGRDAGERYDLASGQAACGRVHEWLDDWMVERSRDRQTSASTGSFRSGKAVRRVGQRNRTSGEGMCHGERSRRLEGFGWECRKVVWNGENDPALVWMLHGILV